MAKTPKKKRQQTGCLQQNLAATLVGVVLLAGVITVAVWAWGEMLAARPG